MKLARGHTRSDGFKLNGYTKSGKEHWLHPDVFDAINNKHQILRWKNKLEVYKNYGGCCNACGESDPLVLQIDHVKNNGKDHVDKKGRRVGGGWLYNQIKKAGYPKDEYQLLCANCNARKEWFRRGAYLGE
jgi:hypothetical protein